MQASYLTIRVQASQQCVRDEHTQRRYNRSLVDRESRWSAHRWPSELNADCAIAMRYRRSASSFPSPCSLLPRYSKLGTFSSGGSLPMTTLSRHASAARLLLDLTALSRSPRAIAVSGLRRTIAPCVSSGRVTW